VRPAFAATRRITEATGALTPLIVSGSDSSRARRSSAGSRRADAGGSNGSPSICSIGVARATLLPYWPSPSEIAPITRLTPSRSGQ
jgi:hypothetical protein